jgi:hypothetical protein
MMIGLTSAWKKSERSNGSDSCVEVRLHDQAVQVRDTKDRSGPVLTFESDAWQAFLGDLRDDAFYLP